MFRSAHGVAHFAGQGLALTGGKGWNRCQPNQNLDSKHRSRNSIRFHPAFLSCETG
jgi:hypothetical protein